MKQLRVKTVAGRLSFTLLCAIMFLSGTGLAARDLQQTVRFRSLEPTVLELMESIRNQTDFVFAVNLSKVDIQRRVKLPRQELLVVEALDETLADAGLRYMTSGRQIMVVRGETLDPARTPAGKPAATAIPSTISRSTFTGDRFERAVFDHMAGNPDAQPRTAEPPSVRYDTIRRLIPHDGNYQYGDRRITPSFARAQAAAGFPAARLPLLKIKTNLLYGAAALTPNLSAEIGLGRRTSLEAMGSWNPWRRKGTMESNRKLAHIIVKPEFRYWLCERFDGHYFGAHAFFWRYNVGSYDIPLLFDKEYRYDGRAVGAGVSYGYYWPWSSRWGMEFNAGAGVAFMKYDRYPCTRCQTAKENMKKTYFGPTSAGIKLVFRIQ